MATTPDPLTNTERQALKNLLEDVTISIHPENTKIAVDFKRGILGNAPVKRRVNVNPRPSDELDIDLTPAQEKDVILFLLGHEIMHTVYSDLDSKQEFGDAYPAFSKTAGRLRNLTEDVYVNKQVREQKPGTRIGYAIYSEAFMRGYDPITTYPEPVAYVEATAQLGIGGTVNGLADADADLQEFVARADRLLTECETTDDPDQRHALTHDLVSLIQEYTNLEQASPPTLPPLIGASGDDTTDMPDTGQPQQSRAREITDPDTKRNQDQDPDAADDTTAQSAPSSPTSENTDDTDSSPAADNTDDTVTDEATSTEPDAQSASTTSTGETDADTEDDPTDAGASDSLAPDDQHPTDDTSSTDATESNADADTTTDTSDTGTDADDTGTAEETGTGTDANPDQCEDSADTDPDTGAGDTDHDQRGSANASTPDTDDQQDGSGGSEQDTTATDDPSETTSGGDSGEASATDADDDTHGDGEDDSDQDDTPVPDQSNTQSDTGQDTATGTETPSETGATDTGQDTPDVTTAGTNSDETPADSTGDGSDTTADTPARESADSSPGGETTGDTSSESGPDSESAEGTGSTDTPPEDSELADVPDEYADDLRDILTADEHMDTGRRADVTDTTDYRQGSEFGKRATDRVKAAENAPTTEIDERRDERDARIQDTAIGDIPSPAIRQEYKTRRLADDFENAFRQFKLGTDEVPREDFGDYVNIEGAIRRKCGDMTAPRYTQTQPAELGDRLLVIVADASGSMEELPLKLALMGISHAATEIRDKVAIVAYSDDYDDKTQLVTAPNEEFRDDHLDSFEVGGRTPTPYGIQDGRALADKITYREPVIIVVTDGKANEPIQRHENKGKTEQAVEESAEQVTGAMQDGYPVIGVGVGSDIDEDYMAQIFDEFVHTDMTGLADELAEIYEDQLRSTNAQYASTY